MQARHQRRNFLAQTYEIIKTMEKEDEEESPFQKVDVMRRQRDARRLSSLYGRSLNSIKSIKKKRKVHVDEAKREKEYRFSGAALESFKKKVFECIALCEVGALPLLDELTDKYSSVKDLLRSLEFHYKMKCTIKEVASYIHHIGAAEGCGEAMRADMSTFGKMLCRLVDQNRYYRAQNRRKEQVDLVKAKKKRAQYTLHTYEMVQLSEADMTDEFLISGLEKLTFGVLQTHKMYPKFFTKLCKTTQNTTVTGGSLDYEKLREFCKYNIDIQLTIEEAKAIIVYAENKEGAQSLPIDFLVSQLKLISLDRPCLLSMKVVLSKLAERDALRDEKRLKGGEDEEQVLLLFYEKIDKDSDGYVTYIEFYDFLKEMGFLLADHEIEIVFSEGDSDGDGVIQFHEFVEIISKIERHKRVSPVWLMMKEDALKSLNLKEASVGRNDTREEDDEISIVSQLSQSSNLQSLGSSSRRSHNFSPKTKLVEQTVSSKNHSIEDSSQHSYAPKMYCENCGRRDHSLEYCDRLCTMCVPFCGRRPKKCPIFMQHLKEKSKSSPQKTILAPLPKDYTVHARQSQQISLPTSLVQKFTRSKPGASSSILRATTPVHVHRAVDTLDNLDAASMMASVDAFELDEQSAIFQGDLTRYVQVGLTHLPLAAKANYLRYNLKWKLIANIVKELKGRKIKIPNFMTKLRMSGLGFSGSKRNLQISDKGTPVQPPLDIKDPLGKFGLWLTREQILNTLSETNIGGSLKNRQYLCSCLDPRKRGGVPCHEIVALLTLVDALMYGKHKVDLVAEKRTMKKAQKTCTEISELLEIVFDAIIVDLNAYCELVYVEEKNSVIGSIDTLKHRKELLDLAGVDSSFIDGVMQQKKEELKGKRFTDYLPEGLVEATMCTFTTSHDTEMMILSYVEAMIASRAKRAALEKMSFEVARPENLEYQEIPKSYVLEYVARGQSYMHETIFEEWRTLLYISSGTTDNLRSKKKGNSDSNDQEDENDGSSVNSQIIDDCSVDESKTSEVSIETLTTMTYT